MGCAKSKPASINEEEIPLQDLSPNHSQNENENIANKNLPFHDQSFYKNEGNLEERIKMEIEKDSNILDSTSTDANGRTALHMFTTFVYNGLGYAILYKLIGMLLEFGKEILKTPNDDKDCPVHLALKHSKFVVLKALLSHDFELQFYLVGSKGNTLFHMAAILSMNDFETFKKIIDQFDNRQNNKFVMLAQSKNDNGLAPIHLAVKSNSDSKILDFFLENYNETSDLEKPLLAYILDLIDNSKDGAEKRLMTLKKIIQKHKERPFLCDLETSFHKAAKLGLPSVIKLLIAEEIEGWVKDEFNRLPLYYALTNSLNENGVECLEILLENNLFYLKDIFEKDDKNPETLYEIAMENCTTETIKMCLRKIFKTDKIEFGLEKLPTELYSKSPQVLEYILNNSFSIKTNGKNEKELMCNFSYITNKYKTNQNVEHKKDQDQNVEDTLYLRNLVQKWNSEGQRIILKTPAVQVYVYKKLKELQPYLITMIIIQVLWVMFLLTFSWKMLNSDCFSSKQNCTWNYLNWKEWVLFIVVFLYSSISLVYELFEFKRNPKSHFLYPVNSLQLTRNVLFITTLILHLNKEPEAGKACGAIAIFLGFMLSTRHLRHIHKDVVLSLNIFQQVVWEITKLLMHCSLILAGFFISILILFQSGPDGNDHEITSMNSTLPVPIFKLIIMMIGEMDFDSFSSTMSKEDTSELITLVTRCILFATFLIVLVLAFYNQLTGVALDKFQDLTEKADVERVISKVEYIYLLETIQHFLEWCHADSIFNRTKFDPYVGPYIIFPDSVTLYSYLDIERPQIDEYRKMFILAENKGEIETINSCSCKWDSLQSILTRPDPEIIKILQKHLATFSQNLPKKKAENQKRHLTV